MGSMPCLHGAPHTTNSEMSLLADWTVRKLTNDGDTIAPHTRHKPKHTGVQSVAQQRR